jgi:ribonuclease HI
VKLANDNRVQLLWVPGHESSEANENADQLAKLRSARPLIGFVEFQQKVPWKLSWTGQRP